MNVCDAAVTKTLNSIASFRPAILKIAKNKASVPAIIGYNFD